jgi:putative aldouronate transport system permease protein
MILVPLLFYIVFRYIPIGGNIIAFRRYRAGSSIFGDEWSGLKYFRLFWNDNNFWRAFGNTLILNVMYLIFRFPMTLIFALFLNEIRQLRWKKFVQTASYLPHFISIVIVAGMVREIISTDGPLNRLLEIYTGSTITFITLPEWFPTIYVVSGLWQSLGWGTILYLAAMSSISPTLYEVAQVDGAGRLRQAWNITLPLILPTVATLLILDIGGLVGSGMAFEKIFLLYNPLTYDTADVISTYLFRVGITSGNYSYATAINLFEGLINLVLLSLAVYVARRVSDTGLW